MLMKLFPDGLYFISSQPELQYYVINVNIVPDRIFSLEKKINHKISFRVPSFTEHNKRELKSTFSYYLADFLHIMNSYYKSLGVCLIAILNIITNAFPGNPR